MTINQKKAYYKDDSFSERRKRYLLAKKKKRAKKRGIFLDSPPKRDLDILFDNYKKNHFDTAIKLGALITQNFPDHPDAWHVLGASLLELGKMKEALIVNQKVVDLSPNDSNAHNNLGNSFKGVDRLHKAVSSYKKSISLDQNNATAHSNLANTLIQLHNYAEAEVHYKKAILLEPNYSEAHHNFGRLLSNLGRLDEAKVCFENAITMDPTFARGHRMYSLIKHFETKDEQYSKMQDIYLDQDTSENQRCEICFALGKASEDLQDYKQAFKFLSEGNRLRKKALSYNIEQDFELFRQIKSTYIKIGMSKLEIDQPMNSIKPIFIIGMPRSGTTLVEQIIACHSSVTGAGELTFAQSFGSSIARGADDCGKNELMSFRQKYMKSLEKFSVNKSIVTDKMPLNFRYLGLISAAFPEAKIVHVKRHPGATCWANYKSFFPTRGLGYCYNLDDISSYYSLYKDLMAFWEEAFGERMYHLDYELLTKNQDNETRRLIDYLNLEWEDDCLTPENNTRVVETASNAQVRQSVYRGSSQKWQMFKPFLNGIFDHL